jgi:hypothetical protein
LSPSRREKKDGISEIEREREGRIEIESVKKRDSH